jgi:hypothetical protein
MRAARLLIGAMAAAEVLAAARAIQYYNHNPKG